MPPAVEVHLDPAQGGDAVRHQQRVAPAHRGAECLQRMLAAGRGLPVDDGQQARVGVVVQGREQALVRDVLAPVRADLDHLGAAAPGDLGDPRAEVAAGSDDHRLARLDQVGEAGLHPRCPSRLQRQDQPALGAVDAAEHVDDVEQDLVQLRVQVPEHRLLHRLEGGGVDVARPGPAEQPL